LEKEEEVVLDGTEVGDRRGLSSMYLAKLAREVVELAKMGLKVSRNSVYAGGGVMVTVFS
jgi:hypothetical protein